MYQATELAIGLAGALVFAGFPGLFVSGQHAVSQAQMVRSRSHERLGRPAWGQCVDDPSRGGREVVLLASGITYSVEESTQPDCWRRSALRSAYATDPPAAGRRATTADHRPVTDR